MSQQRFENVSERQRKPIHEYHDDLSYESSGETRHPHLVATALEISSSSSSSNSRECWDEEAEEYARVSYSSFLLLQKELSTIKDHHNGLRQSAEKWKREAERLLKIGEDMKSVIMSKEHDLEHVQSNMQRSLLEEKSLKRQVKALKIKNLNLRNSIENLEIQMKRLKDVGGHPAASYP